MRTLTKKQQNDLKKAEKLMLEVQRLFESATQGVDWCPMFGQTESSIDRSVSVLSGYVQSKTEA